MPLSPVPPENQTFVHPYYKKHIYFGALSTALAINSLFTSWESAKIVGATTCIGVAYATISDLFMCRYCIEYFNGGHRYNGKRLEDRPIRTLNPNWNALIWGMISSWHLSALGGIFLAALSRVPISPSMPKLSARQVIPNLAAGASLLFAATFFLFWKKCQLEEREELFAHRIIDQKRPMPREMQVKFERVSCHNGSSYVGMAIILFMCATFALGIRIRKAYL